MTDRKVELLAPAGNYACFLAALNAGADAVYLGGTKFGARAYAGNFITEEIIAAIRAAHLFQKKIYLTVNTLIKENEMPELVPYILPLYDAGLDGVIVQDIGALKVLRESFPGLELHASTQMTITGIYGAEFVKALGVCRVVPARELSLDEIKDIKEKTNLEIECFIHGAMCYAYSGQCLFSSILGGRSGNRGRCAGPCRLPYSDEKGKKLYPLSLKDMYTLSIIPKLIDAGIDSFKIEGRMKSPEYVAGVTSIYRKYIDSYLRSPNKKYCVEKKDEELLRKLYIRSDICNGYYEKHNDRTMITISEPGYSGSDADIIEKIRKKYIEKHPAIQITGSASVFKGKPAQVTLSTGILSVTVEGDIAGEAISRPLSAADISDRLSKLGDTYFEIKRLDVSTDNSSFMTVKALNELRRKACAELENVILENRKTVRNACEYKRLPYSADSSGYESSTVAVYVSTKEQLNEAILNHKLKIIYINSDLFCENKAELEKKLKLYDKQYFFALPHILRKRSYKYLEQYRQILEEGLFSGVLVRNFEEVQWLKEIDYKGQKISDFSIYAWNNDTISDYGNQFDRITLPVELNKKELYGLSGQMSFELLVYGRLPLMYTANCIQNTLKGCINKKDIGHAYMLTDRYKNDFPIVQNCVHCYNVLYNTIPVSLHGQLDGILKKGFSTLRLDFTLENGYETKNIIDYYIRKSEGDAADFKWKDYTNGHFKRGVE